MAKHPVIIENDMLTQWHWCFWAPQPPICLVASVSRHFHPGVVGGFFTLEICAAHQPPAWTPCEPQSWSPPPQIGQAKVVVQCCFHTWWVWTLKVWRRIGGKSTLLIHFGVRLQFSACTVGMQEELELLVLLRFHCWKANSKSITKQCGVTVTFMYTVYCENMLKFIYRSWVSHSQPWLAWMNHSECAKWHCHLGKFNVNSFRGNLHLQCLPGCWFQHVSTDIEK